MSKKCSTLNTGDMLATGGGGHYTPGDSYEVESDSTSRDLAMIRAGLEAGAALMDEHYPNSQHDKKPITFGDAIRALSPQSILDEMKGVK